jgi:hypothetical protein
LAVVVLHLAACSNNNDDLVTMMDSQGTTACNFSSLTATSMEDYDFSTNFSDFFSESPRWESENADITLVNGRGQLNANSSNTSQALEAWKLFKTQMPYNKSWQISVDVNLPLFWNSNGGNNAQVGAGIFVGLPVASGQSSKVYECNFAVVNGGGRFVQAQLIANRLGADPIDVQNSTSDQSKENATLRIEFCTSNKTLTLFIDNSVVGVGRAIDSNGLDNWQLTETGVMDVGIMGFAENTVITSNQPTVDNFSYRIY